MSVHHPALIQNTGPLIDMSDIRPGTSKCSISLRCLCYHYRLKITEALLDTATLCFLILLLFFDVDDDDDDDCLHVVVFILLF